MISSTCRRCHKPIVSVSGSFWVHLADFMVGCRAASFTPEKGWDESLNRRWKATPK